ncbi:MAG: hypothetical protein EXR32_04520 [Betaproteobacteria bacterium]|nr:hypothetical protein [Betaproteobacteria bacterium]
MESSGLVLAAKVAAAAIIVVTASRATERAGPLLGAMIATLPVSAGPVYVFLAIDHGAAFISESARMSVAATAATAAFVGAHAVAAQRLATPASLALATLAWFAVALALQFRDWSFVEACLLYVGAFILAIRGLRRYAVALEAPPVPRARFDLALRALLVAVVVLATTYASHALGPTVAGVLATYPVVFTCLVLILQPRCGGRFAASVLVISLKGMLGFGLALAVLHLAAARMSVTAALLLALAVAVAWNTMLLVLNRRRLQFPIRRAPRPPG